VADFITTVSHSFFFSFHFPLIYFYYLSFMIDATQAAFGSRVRRTMTWPTRRLRTRGT
jgi:hypothetical protein